MNSWNTPVLVFNFFQRKVEHNYYVAFCVLFSWPNRKMNGISSTHPNHHVCLYKNGSKVFCLLSTKSSKTTVPPMKSSRGFWIYSTSKIGFRSDDFLLIEVTLLLVEGNSDKFFLSRIVLPQNQGPRIEDLLHSLWSVLVLCAFPLFCQ